MNGPLGPEPKVGDLAMEAPRSSECSERVAARGGFAAPGLSTRREYLQGLAAAGLLATGCGSEFITPVSQLVIATDLPEPLTTSLTRAFRAADPGGPPVVWRRLEPFGDPSRLVVHDTTIQAVLTGAVWSLDRLAAAGRLEALGSKGLRKWRSFRRGEVGLALRTDLFEARGMEPPTGWAAWTDPRMEGFLALGDPRRDPATLALARARLATTQIWAGGYAEWLRAGGLARPIGRTPEAALVELAQGAVAAAPGVGDALPAIIPTVRILPLGPGPPAGLGLVRRAEGPTLAARRFVAFLEQRQLLESETLPPAISDTLLADLLGAVVVEAQPELIEAFRVLRSTGGRPDLEARLTEAPPWPPASVQELKTQASATPLVEALADEIAPSLEARFWLLESWNRKPEPIGGPFLEELADAAQGRLVAEPRFRGWLRGEWTAWARQRARRVARQARNVPSGEARTA